MKKYTNPPYAQLTPHMGRGQHIITICRYNKPCRYAKLKRVRNKGKTHLYKICLFKGTCNQKERVGANKGGILVD